MQPLSPIGVIVGSNNPVKLNAAKEVFSTLHPNNMTLISYKADPGITNWKSKHGIGQPFGIKQTAEGVINRTKDCWNHQNELFLQSYEKKYAICFENGLVAPNEVGQDGKNWYDICFTGLTDGNRFIILRGSSVKTTFSPLDNSQGELFDSAVLAYENEVMPLIHEEKDLYQLWTNNLKTREGNLIESGLQALHILNTLKKADKLITHCKELGFPASVGPRYNAMFWMRDFAYMSPIYLELGFQKECLEAVRNIKNEQIKNHAIIHDGYCSLNTFGNIPITYIPKVNERKFLLQRIQGSIEEPNWQMQLWDFCKKQCPELLCKFPRIQSDIDDLESRPQLDQYTYINLLQYYNDLLFFFKEVQEKYPNIKPPGPSFALRSFIDGTLRNLTPGTKDSEIHYLRAIFTLINNQKDNKASLLNEFSESMAHAIFYLYSNVVDEQDGLPLGTDSRDIFSDILYDSKTLSNAVFLYEVVQFLNEYGDALKETSFSLTLLQILNREGCEPPKIITQMATSDLTIVFSKELKRLKASIQNQLLFKGERFEPIDFIPGKRASIALNNPIISTPVADIIKNHHPSFVDGTVIDPQGLAYAVLTDLIAPEYYKNVIELFKSADSKIGVQVFVPISGKSKEEDDWLRKVKGNVVWPHVTWTVVRALIKMDAPHFAEEQIEKLMKYSGFSEWVAFDPEREQVYKGGDNEQGWSATAMKMGMSALLQHYSLEK